MASTRKVSAFAVHLLTASGSFFAFLALVAAAEQRWVATFLWLGAALLIDGVDGPLARKVDIKNTLPNWSGDILDSIIDYTTFVVIPALALYGSGLLEPFWAGVAAGLIVVSAAVYYADTRMKTADNFFRGFPVAWNMLVFVFFALRPDPTVVFAIVAICTAATFMPVKFLHPVRVVRLRPLNLAMMFAWSAAGLYSLLNGFEAPGWIEAVLTLSSLYLFSIGVILQILDRMRAPA